MPLRSVSIANFMEGSTLLSMFVKLDDVYIFSMMMSVSSTYLHYKEGTLPSRLMFWLNSRIPRHSTTHLEFVGTSLHSYGATRIGS